MTWDGLSPPYPVIVVDPPWSYAESGRDSRRRGVNPGSPDGYRRRAVHLPYSTMTLGEIKALPVADLAGDGARLFLWVTNRHLRHAWDVVEAWGFRPSERVLVWCKRPRGTMPVTTEFVLLATRGRVPRMRWIRSTWFQWDPPGHSVKPPAFYDLVEGACEGPYLDVFGRQGRLGWDSWGRGVEALPGTAGAAL